MNAPLNLLKEKNERMKQCPQCDTGYPDSHATCPTHGVLLNEIRDLKPGMLIHKTYRIVRKLGQGGMGAVYLAQHIFMEEPRALKFLSAELSQDEAFTGRFRREVRTLRQLRHNNVVDCGDLEPAEDDSLFFPMEFVDGPDLRAFLNSVKGTGFSEKGTGFSPYIESNRSDGVLTPEGTLPVEQALHLTRQIAEGLGAAHAKGMVHRDIKPENILMAREGGAWLPKIADFGIVATKENSSVFTRTGGTLLTMTYAAPEQWRGTPAAELDGRTDLYALGGLLYEMLTGQTPFHAESYEGWARHHQTTPPPPPSALRPDLANWQGLDALVLRLLAKGREDRPKDVAELLRLLDTLRYFPPDARRETVREVAQERTDRKRRRSKLIRVLAISALMFLMAFAVWITYQRTRKPKAVDYEALAKKYGGVLVQPPQPPSQQQIRGGKIATFNLSDIDRPHNVDSSNNWDESHGNASTQKANVQVGGKTVIVPVEKPTDPMHPPGGVPKPSIPESEVSEETNSVSELTWTDKVTGLMWTRKDGSRDVTWFQAVDFCGHLQLGGYSDWRLPTIDELQGIYDQNVNIQGQWGKENSIVMHIKGNLQLSGWLWSSSLQVDSNRAWFSDFHRGLWVPSRLNESNNGRALCVRQVEK